MKLLNLYEFPPLLKLKTSMGIPLDYVPKLDYEQIRIKETEFEIVIDINKVGISKDGSFVIKNPEGKNVHVLLYIQNQKFSKESKYKFHLSDCSTLIRMESELNNKYIVSNKSSGKFVLHLHKNDGTITESIQELKVCKNCLKKINYKNYKDVSQEMQSSIYNNFSLKDFFASYSNQIIRSIPKR